MAVRRDYYEILGVDRKASEEEIKRAFRRLAMEYHPDRNRNEDAEQRFKEVSEAYQVLSDAEKRQTYDRFGHAGLGGNGVGQGFEDADIFGGFGDIFDAFFGGGFRRRPRAGPQRGSDLQVALDLDFNEAALGTEKEVTINRLERCERCKGNRSEPGTSPQTCATCKGAGQVRRSQQSLFGQFVQVVPCPTCDGEGQSIPRPCTQCGGAGQERKSRARIVTIPSGADDGTRIRLAGDGNAGSLGGPPGDLYVVLRVQPHRYFERDGFDLLYELPINFVQAALGDTVEVPTLEGTTPLKIPAGIQSGTVQRVRNEGVPYLRRKGRGDLLVSVRVVTPTSLSPDQRELFEKLAGYMERDEETEQSDEGWFDRLRNRFGS